MIPKCIHRSKISYGIQKWKIHKFEKFVVIPANLINDSEQYWPECSAELRSNSLSYFNANIKQFHHLILKRNKTTLLFALFSIRYLSRLSTIWASNVARSYNPFFPSLRPLTFSRSAQLFCEFNVECHPYCILYSRASPQVPPFSPSASSSSVLPYLRFRYRRAFPSASSTSTEVFI